MVPMSMKIIVSLGSISSPLHHISHLYVFGYYFPSWLSLTRIKRTYPKMHRCRCVSYPQARTLRVSRLSVRTLAAWCLGRGTFFMEQSANGSLIPAA